MCLNEICRDLTAVNETVSEWSAGVPVSDIEKDAVLEKLRAVYSMIKLIEVGDVCAESDDIFTECAAETEQPVTEEPDAEEIVTNTPDVKAVQIAADEQDTCEEEKILSDAVKKRKVLLSLYDQQIVEQEDTLLEPVAHSIRIEHHTTVLGDVMKTGEQTLGEIYAQHTKHHDISSEINSRPVETLSGAIGINDKFLMIRDMFDGDAAAYDAAMETFESFYDLDDAMVYIYENFNWDPNSEGVTMLVDLLTRKLS